jgi:hypothetical protein
MTEEFRLFGWVKVILGTIREYRACSMRYHVIEFRGEP